MMIPQKGDLVYLPSDIMLIDGAMARNWIKLDEPTTGVIIECNLNDENIYHKIHVRGNDWLVRTIDTMEVMSSA